MVVSSVHATIRPRLDDDFKACRQIELSDSFLEQGRLFADLDKRLKLVPNFLERSIDMER